MRIKVNTGAPSDLNINGKALAAGQEYDLSPHEARVVIRHGHATAVKPEAPAAVVEKAPAKKKQARKRAKK